MILNLIAQAAGVPFPTSDPSPVSQLGADASATALSGAKAAAAASVAQMDGLWELYTTPNGVYWLSLMKGITPLMIIGFVCWSFAALYQWNTSGRGPFPFKTLVPVVIVVFLLSANGRLLSGAVQTMRFIPQKIENVILDTAVKGITGREMIQKVAAKNAAAQEFNDRMRQCTAVVKDAQTCKDQVQLAAKRASDAANPLGLPANTNTLTDIVSLPATLAWSGVKMGMIGAIIGALTSLSYASHYFFGLIQVLWASLAPVFCAMHLIPNAPNLKIFFSGFIGISLATVFNSAFQVGTASMLAVASDWDPLILPLMNGVLGVLFSGLIAYLGITGVYATIGTSASAVARVIPKLGK